MLGRPVMRTPYSPSHQRRILCVYPRYARSFGTFHHSYGFFGGRVRAFMPPQGLLVVVAYLPESWEVRFVDENRRAATEEDFRWADAVFVSGMHIQRPQIHDIIARAHAHGRVVVVGGPSVSGCPEYYPDADLLHVGELGDATDRVIEHLDRHPGRPPRPLRFDTGERLPLLVAWQTRHRYPLRFACEATLNIAKNERVLELMREAGFITVFCGIETPEPEALRSISKDQNLRMPILDAVERINAYGLEVVSGIILGLDSDGPQTADHIIDFIHASRIPMLTINVLYALPKTPLWDRLTAEGRLTREAGRESNVVFKLPYETVIGMWRRCITAAYAPEALYARFAHNVAHTFARRKAYPSNPQRASWGNVRMGLGILARLMWRVGVRGSYRRTFWRFAWPALKSGEIEGLIHTAIVSYHLIEFTQDCLRGLGEPSFYSSKAGGPEMAAHPNGGPEMAPKAPSGSGRPRRGPAAPRERRRSFGAGAAPGR